MDMRREHVLGVLVAVGLLALGVGAAAYAGFGPIAGSPNSDEPTTDFPTATPGGTESSARSSSAPFTFTVDAIEECGQTCRDVTVTLHNHRNDTATGITVYTRIYAGRDNTAEDDVVWEQQRDVGTMDAGESITTTERVELSLRDGLKIEREDGWITVVTTVESDQETATFEDSMQVA